MGSLAEDWEERRMHRVEIKMSHDYWRANWHHQIQSIISFCKTAIDSVLVLLNQLKEYGHMQDAASRRSSSI